MTKHIVKILLDNILGNCKMTLIKKHIKRSPMSGSFIDAEIDNIVDKFPDEPVIKALKILNWSRIIKISNKVKLSNIGRHRAPYSPILMTKIFLLQSMFGYSDVAMEKQLYFNLLFMKFCDLSTTDRKPDHSTISIWRSRFVEKKIHEKLFAEINKQFEKLGLLLKCGSVIDATIISSQARPRKRQLVVNESPEDNTNKEQPTDNIEKNIP